MRPKELATAMAGALLLCAPAGTGWSHETAGDEPAAQVHGSMPDAEAAAEDAGPFGGTVIERSLGDGPAETIVVLQGEVVRLVLHAPAGTELHLHGYDLTGTAADGAPVVMTFHAEHPGRFPIEAHGVEDVLGRTDRALAYVEVRPE